MSQETENTTAEMVENQTAEQSQENPQKEDPNKVVLLGTISYNNEEEYSKWFQTHYGVSNHQIKLLPLGADDRVFKPLYPKRAENVFRCLYYGTFIPNHGVPPFMLLFQPPNSQVRRLLNLNTETAAWFYVAWLLLHSLL